MHKRSSCAKIATVRRCSSVAARKMRTAISLRFAAINFLTCRMAGTTVSVAATAPRVEPELDAGDLVSLVAEERVRGIWTKPAGLKASRAKGKTQVCARHYKRLPRPITQPAENPAT